MILGFAHITKNVDRLPVDDGTRSIARPIESAPAKWPLMARQATSHYLLLQRQASGMFEEIVEYDTGMVDQHLNRLDLCGDRIILTARKPPLEMCFFIRGLGLDNGVTWVGLNSHVRKWNVKILVVGDAIAPIDQPLDVAGYAALAFYSSDVEGDRDRALAAGGRAPTEPFTIKLVHDMKIVMLRSPEGTIIELIEVMK